MKAVSGYLSRQNNVVKLAAKPAENLFNSVVIPCYNESNLEATLRSISACKQPEKAVEVIVVLNFSETESSLKQRTTTQYDAFLLLANTLNRDGLTFHFILAELPKKHAGVGLARKTGMDVAVDRFASIGQSEGVITCFDADALCDSNYLCAIEDGFAHESRRAAAIRYEHPVNGADFDPEVYRAIIQYESFLRYYRQGLVKAGHPHSFHTVGSSMAVRVSDYCMVGGMNKKKAGEDFYFLQKFIQRPGFFEINNTRVIPSPRISDRVPFGTGKAVGEMVHERKYEVYDPRVFDVLKQVLDCVKNEWSSDVVFGYDHGLSDVVLGYLKSRGWADNVGRLKSEVKELNVFEIRFLEWFNLFEALKLVHELRDVLYPNVDLLIAGNSCFGWEAGSELELLTKLRELEYGVS